MSNRTVKVSSNWSLMAALLVMFGLATGWRRAHALGVPAGQAGGVDVAGFGCAGDGVTDDSDCFQKAVNAAANKRLSISPPSVAYRIRKAVHIKTPITITSNYGRILHDFPPDTPTPQGMVFSVESSNVAFDKLWFDGSGLPHEIGDVDREEISSEAPRDRHYQNITVRNCRFTNLMQYNIAANPHHALPYVHAFCFGVRLINVDNSLIESNSFDTLSGFAIFLLSTNGNRVLNNTIDSTITGSIMLNSNNHHTEVAGNKIYCTKLPYCRYWGGSIDVTGQHTYKPDLGPDSDLHIHHNYMEGYHMYGAVIRLNSPQNVIVDHNVIHNVKPFGTVTSMILVDARGAAGIDMSHRNPSDFVIDSNEMTAMGTNEVGIYVINRTPPGAFNLPAGKNFVITNNRILSVDSNNYFQNGIIVHGGDAGIHRVEIANNTYSGRSLQGPLAGGITIAGEVPGALTDVTITGNTITWFTASGALGPPPPAAAFGIYIAKNCDGVKTSGNTIQGFTTGIEVSGEAGNNISGLQQNSVTGARKAINLNGKQRTEGYTPKAPSAVTVPGQ
jgi:hypothetical protein